MESRKIGFELHKTSRLIKRYMDSDAAKSYVDKVTGTHGWAIGYLYHNRDRDIFQKDFEQEFNIRRSTASTILTLMEKNGLINRESVDYDARLKKITLTDKAIEIQTFVEASFDRMENMLGQGISDSELEIFFSVLDKICKNLNNPDSEAGI
ncbi:MAG: MarR family transcriptional regulator [Clostridia bacterium]|nr:MarR family transcriptional regulator [Clostridia bacterium]